MSLTALPIDPEVAYRVAAKILDCACKALALTQGGCPSRVCVVPGEQVEFANCCDGDGQLTVNVVNIYPSKDFPNPFVGENANCAAPYDVVSYNVTVLRCASVGQDDQAPDCGTLDDEAFVEMTDMFAIRAGLRCCLADKTEMSTVIGSEVYRWVFGDNLTVGPEGGCAGSQLIVLVGLPTCGGCP